MTHHEVVFGERLIVALDLDDISRARALVNQLKSYVGLFKVGHQLFTRYGPAATQMIHDEGGRIFLDLKYHDIPNTVKLAVEAAVALKVTMLNFHALGGKEMMAAAVSAAHDAAAKHHVSPPILLAVTILTSLADPDLVAAGIAPPVAEEVARLAYMANEAGVNGVVASPQEIPIIRSTLPADFLIVTPGVRLSNSLNDDQKRVLTPGEALRTGADYIVVGRPIVGAPDPVHATQELIRAMAL
ncbi:MAG: orotidine-5'-phosphate decarboxylase [Deltaproteobacteria bacterium]|nr:orotidine-5'-phosphate decarboxylase [Deltaproteobacteria bacterium]